MTNRKATDTDAPSWKLINVSDLIAKQQKYILFIDESDNPETPRVVPIINGDVHYNVPRGKHWIVPEAIVTVLRDAVGERVDDQGRTVGKTRSYPWTASKYDGPLPLKTMVDEFGEPAALDVPQYA